MKKALFIFVILPVLFSFQANGQPAYADTVSPSPIGQLIDVGGYKLHVTCTGKGIINVILIPGATGFSFDWTAVQEKLSTFSRVCSYDRPGLAWSDAGPMPRSLSQDVYELHQLLKLANIKPPYILVGHSLGGLIARKYAKKYPGEVNGMLLLDATSENGLVGLNGKVERLRLLASPGKEIPPVKTNIDSLTKIPSEAEIQDQFKMFGEPSTSPPFDKLPPGIQKIRIWAQRLPKYYIADAHDFLAEEFAEIYSDSMAYKIGNKPLVVCYSTRNDYPTALGQQMRDSMMKDKIKNQQAFLKLSTNCKMITTTNSGHEIFLTEPDLVTSAVREIISSLKTKAKLK